MKTGARTLVATGLLLIAVLAVREVKDALPREPRIMFTNVGPGARLVIDDEDRTVDLGLVREKERVELPRRRNLGSRYAINGRPVPVGELDRVTEIARRERRDVELGLDFHGCLTLEG